MTTPAENIAAAQRLLDVLGQPGIGPGTQMYQNLAERAIGHGLLAVADVLTEMLALLDAKQAPVVPGMPKGYAIATQQAPEGEHNWRYVVSGPDFSYASRYRWGTSEGALGAGITHCKDQERHRTGLATVNGQAEPQHGMDPFPELRGEHADARPHVITADEARAETARINGNGA